MGSLFLDVRNRAIGHTIPYRGTLTGLKAEPRGLLVPALLANASGVVAVPSVAPGLKASSRNRPPGAITRPIGPASDLRCATQRKKRHFDRNEVTRIRRPGMG